MSLNFALQDLVSSERIKEDEVGELEKKLQGVKVPELSKEQMAVFVLSCDHDLDFTVTTIKEYYRARKDGPELFDERDVDNEDLEAQLKVVEYSIFPKRTAEGYAILYHRLQDYKYCNYCIKPSMKLLFMTLDSAVIDNPPNGLIIIFDMKGVGLLHLTRISISAVRKFCHYLQEGLPIKLQEIHVLNVAPFIDKIMVIVRPFLKKELLEKLHFHLPDDDMEDVYRVVPKECMPSDLGGDLADVATLHSQNTEKLKEMAQYFKTEQEHRHSYYRNNV